MADYFAAIGDAFTPLRARDLPAETEGGEALQVGIDAVRSRLKECKKPRGLLYGDVFPELIDQLAPIITHVLNSAYAAEKWPDIWKIETVTSIPKKSCPQDISELRNSCTPLLSKVMEYFVLEELKKQIYPGINQFGGLTDCGTTHYLIEAWDNILEAMDPEGTSFQ